MSATPETVVPKKRGRKSNAEKAALANQPIPNQPQASSGAAEIPTESPESHLIPIVDGIPVEQVDYTCCIPTAYEYVKMQDGSQEKKFHYCQKTPEFNATVVMKGHRQDKHPKNIKKTVTTECTIPFRFQGVCAEHKAKIDANPRVLLTPNTLNTLARDASQMGFGDIQPQKTRLKWEPWVEPEPAVESEHMAALEAIVASRQQYLQDHPYGDNPNGTVIVEDEQ